MTAVNIFLLPTLLVCRLQLIFYEKQVWREKRTGSVKANSWSTIININGNYISGDKNKNYFSCSEKINRMFSSLKKKIFLLKIHSCTFLGLSLMPSKSWASLIRLMVCIYNYLFLNEHWTSYNGSVIVKHNIMYEY